MRRTVLCVLNLLAVQAMAFDFEEHKYVSNVALRIALADAAVGEKLAAAAKDLADATAADEHRSFGDIVGLADYIPDPNPVFNTDLLMPPDASVLPPADWLHLQNLKRDRLRWASATHSNENHFQRLALIAHLNNHHHAMNEARQGHALRAILFEAYALHFIEDFLSPGHVATGRSGMADFVAIGLHDRYGARGLQFRFAPRRDVADLARKVGNGELPVDLRPHKDSKLVLDSQSFSTLAELIRTGDTLHLFGDSRLADHPVQAAFVTLVAAHSIREMLLAKTSTEFEDYCWSFGYEPRGCDSGRREIPKRDRTNLRAARIAFGAYDAYIPDWAFFAPGEVLLLGYENSYVPGGRSEAPAGRWSVNVETLAIGTAAFDAYSTPAHERRGALYSIYRPLVPAVVIGGSRTYGPRPATGAHVRVIFTIPRTDIQFSTHIGKRRYALRGGGHRTRKTTGFTAEAGFSFVFVRFGAEWEDERKPLGGETSQLFINTGINGVVPGRFVAQKVGQWMRPRRQHPRGATP